jgi:anti-anti-sigma factor
MLRRVGAHELTIDARPGVFVIHASGELDALAAPDLERAFADALEARTVVVDLERVSFLDSTALGVVAPCVRRLRERETEVRVVLPRGTARRIFEITTLDRVLPVARSAKEALLELGG